MQKFRINQILAAELFRSLLLLKSPQTAQNADLAQTLTEKIQALRERLPMSLQIETAKNVCDVLFNSEKLIEASNYVF
tara:strand:+ start:2054 stop:2287 length:234 start_codon:yes stop_codon:yes gene_type:complete